MLLGSGLPDDGDDERWAVEVKWDGVRAQIRADGAGGWSMRTRPGHDRSDRFPELAALVEPLRGHQVVLDGELVCLDSEGKPDFGAIRRRLVSSGPVAAERDPVMFMAFDLLHLDGEPVRALPYVDRQWMLRELRRDGPGWRVPEKWIGNIARVSEVTRAHGLEGVVCKRLDSSYAAGKRSGAWLKHKHRRRERLMVTAWLPSADGLDVVYLSRVGDDGRSRPAGAVQFGLTAAQRTQLREELRARARPRPRGALQTIAPGVWIDVDAHGRPDGPLRDAVMRDLTIAS
jgi:bifunctional non-homologous end joining protein LigD